MVTLSRIYTKTGDGGETSLGDGARVPKDHPRVAAYGTVDELNAVLGLLVSLPSLPPELSLLKAIQNDLLDLGADLCVPIEANEAPNARLRIQPVQIEKLEQAIDRLNAGLPILRSFVIPGGPPAAACAYLAKRSAAAPNGKLSPSPGRNPSIRTW